jgi:hypothetical protein
MSALGNTSLAQMADDHRSPYYEYQSARYRFEKLTQTTGFIAW